MVYDKSDWLTSFEDYLSILRPHLTGERSSAIALIAWKGHHGIEPIRAARLVAEELASAKCPSMDLPRRRYL
jgi:hypothetical protein